LSFEDFAVQIQQSSYVAGRDPPHPAFGADSPLSLSGRGLKARERAVERAQMEVLDGFRVPTDDAA
jgi:hypothetical protein